MTGSPQKRVVTIGGGLAGMSAAEAISDSAAKHLRVTLLEAKRQTGGRTGSFNDSNSEQPIDYCQHVAMGCCTNFIQLMQRNGLDQEFRRYRDLQFCHPDHEPCPFVPSRWLPPPFHLMQTLGALRYLSDSQRKQIRSGLWSLMRSRTNEIRKITALDWLAGNGQEASTIREFWDVILVSALGEETDSITMSAAKMVFIDGFAASRQASDVLIPTVPLSELFGRRLPERLTSRGVEIVTGDPVDSIDETGGGPVVLLASGKQIRADHVIVAVPWYGIKKLLSTTSARAAIPGLAEFAGIPSSPITGIHLWFDRPITDRPHAVMVGTISQWLFRDPTGVSTAGEHYCQVVISASHEARRLPKSELIEQVLKELRHAFPCARSAKLLRHLIVTDPNAVFSIRPDVDAIRPTASTALPWLHLAGDWIATGWPATMEGAVISGRRAAASVLNREELPPTKIDDGLPRGWLARCLIKP